MKLTSVVLCVLGIASALFTAPQPAWAAPCAVGKTGCGGTGDIGPGGPGGGGSFDFGAGGSGLGDVDLPSGTLTWSQFDMLGNSPQFGKFNVTLSPDSASVGSIVPNGNGSFTSTINFFFRIDTDSSGVLTSNTPVVLQSSSITSFPPKTLYTMVGPSVDFYAVGDGSQTRVFTINQASVHVAPLSETPTLSQWAAAALAGALVLATVLWLRLRRRSAVTA